MIRALRSPGKLNMVGACLLLMQPVIAEDIPKTPWGVPDLQGVWTNATSTPLERPDEYANTEVLSEAQRGQLGEAVLEKYGQGGREAWFDLGLKALSNGQMSLIIHPKNGKIPWKNNSKTTTSLSDKSYHPWETTAPGAPFRSYRDLDTGERCITDGVGIYPGQDSELSIPDLFGQYSEFARLLELLPEWVECVMLPGNHDAVRPAEPQPTFEKDIQQDYNTTTFVGNPCDFSLHGVRLLSYHGKSIDDFVAGLRTVTYADPVEAMRQMLRRRHLAPQWGGKTPLSPEPEDGLVIREVPDIFVTGHVHGHACVDFKGTTLICSSTWQDQTSYQRMLGFQPKPCMLTIVNLKSHATTAIPFA